MTRILIVDDDPDVVEASQLFLEREGFEVDTALSREEGARKVAEATPDLLILDIMMTEPDDGIAMAQDLRRSGFRNPILMLSSIDKVSGMHFAKNGEVLPVDDFVEKPVKPAVLVGKIKALLEK